MPRGDTPMVLQYKKIKAEHPDCILFFRLGDFYEMFFDDAKTASRELDLVLTSRDRNLPQEERTPMCGVPYHAAEGYIARLIAKGYKVAVCEQTEDPALAKGLVSRDIIRIVTPGTVMEESMLDEGKNNYLASVHCLSGGTGLIFADLSTGEVCVFSFTEKESLSAAVRELARYAPREVLLSPAAAGAKELTDFLKGCGGIHTETERVAPYFETEVARTAVTEQFPSLSGEIPDISVTALGALLLYLKETQKTDLSYLSCTVNAGEEEYMDLDPAAVRNLELTETLRGGEKKGSLLGVIDRTQTPMGRRMLRSWLLHPLRSPVAVNRRLRAVSELTRDSVSSGELTLALSGVPDLERIIGRIVFGSAGARDLKALSKGLSEIPKISSLLAPFSSSLLGQKREELGDYTDLCSELDAAFTDTPPFSVREGGMIRDGYSEEVDRLRGILTGGRDIVAKMEASEREKTGIKTLKVGYNKVFGYYIEVSKGQTSLVPDSYIRKQTLVNGERYITPELKDMEHTILTAEDQLRTLEYQLFASLRKKAADAAEDIQRTAGAVAVLDCLLSLACTATERKYVCPTVDLSDKIEIKDGRHPVVEAVNTENFFVPNDTDMDAGEKKVAIITGPNMAGKSTYMRQVALIVILAQIGSFVPASAAHIGAVDRIFTRIGASDDLSRGQSTFMVEMREVADLLSSATSSSLLILDEIGRGTSTYDGMAIAQAVLEYCADGKTLGAKTLFATHYHELTALEGVLPGVKNYNIAVRKKGDDIVFLRKIVPGGATASYGIEVALLAGVPAPVIRRAKVILASLTSGETGQRTAPKSDTAEITFDSVAADSVREELAATDIDTITPIEAMNLLCKLKKMLG